MQQLWLNFGNDVAPDEVRRRILGAVGDQWIGFLDLVQTTGVRANPLGDMLDLLVRDAVLERHELYYGPHTSPDRLTRPSMDRPRLRGGKLGPSQYYGFEWGYRRVHH